MSIDPCSKPTLSKKTPAQQPTPSRYLSVHCTTVRWCLRFFAEFVQQLKLFTGLMADEPFSIHMSSDQISCSLFPFIHSTSNKISVFSKSSLLTTFKFLEYCLPCPFSYLETVSSLTNMQCNFTSLHVASLPYLQLHIFLL